MARLYVILAIALVAFTIFTLIDCIRTEESRIRALPRIIWIFLIILITPFGGLLWLLLGKQRMSPGGSAQGRSYGGPTAPDDDPEFLRSIGEDKERDARIRELEARLAELDDDQNNSKDK